MAVVIPPWLNVNPSDFVQAAAAGGKLGAEIAKITRANERRTQPRVVSSGGPHTDEAALQGARLQQAAKQAEAERQLRQWEFQQQLKHQQDVLDAQNQRASDSLAERAYYGTNMIDVRKEANRIAQQRADDAASKPSPYDFNTVTTHTKEIPPTKNYDVTEPGQWNLFKANTPPKSFSTTNLTDIQNLPQGSTIATNTIPGTGEPSRTISRRVPINQNPYTIALPDDSAPAPAANIPQAHIDYLRTNNTPQVISDFNAKYGDGAADQFIRADDESQADTQ